jgi:hypothetical protein
MLLIVAAAGFIAAGLGVLLQQGWWRAVAVGAAAFSSIVFILLWDGGWQHLDDKGAVALLLNLAIGIALLGFNWPRFAF